jgi:hypothetical protein
MRRVRRGWGVKMGKRAALQTFWVDDVLEVEVIEGEVRTVLCCTRRGKSVPVLELIGPTRRAPDMAAKVLTAIGSALGKRPN